VKTLILVLFFLIGPAHATYVNCKSEDRFWQVKASLNKDNSEFVQVFWNQFLFYSTNNTKVFSFKTYFPFRTSIYEVDLPGFRYMDFYRRIKHGVESRFGSVEFLVNNNPLGNVQTLDCEFSTKQEF
jgi:hypothetical protein